MFGGSIPYNRRAAHRAESALETNSSATEPEGRNAMSNDTNKTPAPSTRSEGLRLEPQRLEEAEKLLAQRTQMFLIPITILVNALAHADNERLKTGVSVLGLVVTVIWWVCAWQTYSLLTLLRKRKEPEPLDTLTNAAHGPFRASWLTAYALPTVFAVAWFIATVVHACRWSQLPIMGGSR